MYTYPPKKFKKIFITFHKVTEAGVAVYFFYVLKLSEVIGARYENVT